MHRDEERWTRPPYWQRGFQDRYRSLDKLIRRRDLSSVVGVCKRGRQPLHVMVIVLVIDDGVSGRRMMRLEVPMDEVRMMSIVDLCNVDVLRRQKAESQDGQCPERRNQRVPDAEQHYLELSVPPEGVVKPGTWPGRLAMAQSWANTRSPGSFLHQKMSEFAPLCLTLEWHV